jgi:hypothetical protein
MSKSIVQTLTYENSGQWLTSAEIVMRLGAHRKHAGTDLSLVVQQALEWDQSRGRKAHFQHRFRKLDSGAFDKDTTEWQVINEEPRHVRPLRSDVVSGVFSNQPHLASRKLSALMYLVWQ